jgi:endonuclease YncB( thermonuclease family)
MKSIKVKMKWQLLIATALTVAPAAAAFGETYSAQCVSVVDGDTINVMHNGAKQKVILYGVDCPEIGQAFGEQAKQYTDQACFRKTVTIEEHGQDKNGRSIAVVSLQDGSNLNQALVQQGLAWWSDKYAPNDATLKNLFETAKAAHTGLWADAKPIPPWIFRNGQRDVQAVIKTK